MLVVPTNVPLFQKDGPLIVSIIFIICVTIGGPTGAVATIVLVAPDISAVVKKIYH